MKHVTIDLRPVGLVCRFDPVLEHGSTSARKGICHDSCRYQVVWMQDEHIVVIVDDALTSTVEVSNQMDVGSSGAWAVEPGLS